MTYQSVGSRSRSFQSGEYYGRGRTSAAAHGEVLRWLNEACREGAAPAPAPARDNRKGGGIKR
eukprot:9434597-Heterocapsa_arctica.AAC.1